MWGMEFRIYLGRCSGDRERERGGESILGMSGYNSALCAVLFLDGLAEK